MAAYLGCSKLLSQPGYTMKCRMTILALLILARQVMYSDGIQECLKDHYVIVDENGNKIECLACANCAVGRGLRLPCGTKLTEAQRRNIKCIPCEPGKTYSDQHGPNSCKSCQVCPVTMKNCTAESNSQCSRDCSSGRYYDNSTYNCQPCSYCCRKDNKRIAECAGLAAPLQCSVHDALECSSPKTTMNPTSSNYSSNDDHEAVMKVVIGTVIGVAVLVVLTCLAIWILKLRKRDHRGPVDQQERLPLGNETNNCGLSKSSFFLMEDPPFPHEQCKIQEYKQLSLICKNHDNQGDNCNYIYDWKRDRIGLDPPCHEEKIDFNTVQVSDFGRYACQVRCQQHPNQTPAEAIEFTLDVVPLPPRRYKKFKEIGSLEVYDKIGDMLKSPAPDIGDWKRVAEKYEMDSVKIQSLQGDEHRGTHIVDYLKAWQTNLTVYDFCKFMKTIKQNQIVELLINKNHLILCDEQEERPFDARDSGYCPELNGAQLSLVVNVPEQAQNNPGLIDSRQGSRDQLAAGTTLHNGNKNPDKSNRKLDRQTSNQSAKSSGSGSGSASNSLVRKAKGFVRQISQNTSNYKMHDNEHEDPS